MRRWPFRRRVVVVAVGLAMALGVTSVVGTPDLTAATAAAPLPAQPDWQSYVLGPGQANVRPVRVLSTTGEVTGADTLTGGDGAATLTMTEGGPEPAIVLDYGQDVEGIPSIDVASASGSPVLRASYSEGSQYIGLNGDGWACTSAACDQSRADQFTVSGAGVFSTALIQGGERYQELALTSPGTVTISSAGIRFTAYRATAADYRGWFLSSSDQLNRIWYDGAYTTQLDQMPAGTLPAAWTITEGALDANGGYVNVLDQGGSWTDYTDSFQAEIISRQAGWVVRASPSASSGYLFILDADNDPAGPANTLQELYFQNGPTAPKYSKIANVPLGVDLAPGTWHRVQTALSGPAITVSLDGRQVASLDTSGLPSGVPALTAGTVGFRENPGEHARFTDLAVTDPSGATLFADSLASSSALSDFTNPLDLTPDSLPLIMDGAKRDRVVWSGDLGVEGPNVFYTTAADSYVRGSLQLLDSYQNANGESGTDVSPTLAVGSFPETGHTYSASYSMDEVDNIATYYRYTGDLAFVSGEWPMIQRELAYNQSMVDSRGLLVTNASNGRDWDPYDGAKVGAVTAYNVIYYQTLQDAATMADGLGLASEASGYRQQAASLRSAINQYLFDPSTGLYEVSDGQPGTAAEDGNALAVVSGVVPAGENTSILAALQEQLPATPYGPLPFSANTGYRSAVSPFVTNEEVQALFSSGDTQAAIGIIGQLWGHMDAPGPDYTGADWELVGTDGSPGNVNLGAGSGARTSLAHGWASGVTADLSAYVLGVQPASAGYQTWTVAPHPGSLAWSQGRVPTPYGPIDVQWSQQGGSGDLQLQVTVPDGTSGSITVPLAGPHAVAVLHGQTSSGAPVTEVFPAGQGSSVSFAVPAGGSYTVNAVSQPGQ